VLVTALADSVAKSSEGGELAESSRSLRGDAEQRVDEFHLGYHISFARPSHPPLSDLLSMPTLLLLLRFAPFGKHLVLLIQGLHQVGDGIPLQVINDTRAQGHPAIVHGARHLQGKGKMPGRQR